jgi:TIR domain
MATVLVQIETQSHQECRAFATPSGSSVVQLVVTASASADGEALQLFQDLCIAFGRSKARVEPTACGGTLQPHAYGCWATRHQGAVRRTLVWVGDAQLAPPAIAPSQMPSRTRVLPLLPQGASVNSLPPDVDKQVAAFYAPGHIAQCAPHVLTAAGVLDESFRLFISYKWDDSRELAAQLFDALSHHQFDVYLDRFRTNPGTNFLERIREELADKSCVLLLDSEHVDASPWVAAEYAFARQYRLGLMALDLPGGQRFFSRIGCRLPVKNFHGAFSDKSTLADPEIDEIVRWIQQNYFTQISRRFRYQRRLLKAAAKLASLKLSQRPDGVFHGSGSNKDYLFVASARPPGIQEFRVAAQAAGSPQFANASAVAPTPVVVGPLAAQMHQSRQNIEWLATSTRSAAVDEGQLFAAMQEAQRGQL